MEKGLPVCLEKTLVEFKCGNMILALEKHLWFSGPWF